MRSDLTKWTIGPFLGFPQGFSHGITQGPIKLELFIDGEVIVHGTVETGYLYRKLEKAIRLHPWVSTLSYAGRLDPENAVFGELVLCLAVEKIGKTEVPLRAQRIRVVLSELARISNHLSFFVSVARTVDSEIMAQYVLRDREKILDLFELLTGSRFSLGFLCYGGVRKDITDGFIERVLEVCELIQKRIKEYNDIYTFNAAFIKRSKKVGKLSKEIIINYGVTGPNARASGVSYDVRKEQPYCGYEKIDFKVPTGIFGQGDPSCGDVYHRFLLRVFEIEQSIEILKQATEQIPVGRFNVNESVQSLNVPSGEANARVESSRGVLECHVVSDGRAQPNSVQFWPPSVASAAVISKVIEGIKIEDLLVVLASLNISVSEIDQ